MQKDLFGAATITPIPTQFESKPDFLQRYRINLRLDQAIIGVLLCLVAYVFVFSFGVESGKRYAMAEIKAERAMRERMARELGEKIFANQQAAAQESAKEQAPMQAVSGATDSSMPPAGTSLASKAIEPPSALTAKISTESASAAPAKAKFAIQTVTFTSQKGADGYLKKILNNGFQGTVVTQGKFHQVRVVGFETKAEANEALNKLKSKGLAPKDAFIKSV